MMFQAEVGAAKYSVAEQESLSVQQIVNLVVYLKINTNAKDYVWDAPIVERLHREHRVSDVAPPPRGTSIESNQRTVEEE